MTLIIKWRVQFLIALNIKNECLYGYMQN